MSDRTIPPCKPETYNGTLSKMAREKLCTKTAYKVRLTPAQYDHVAAITKSWGIPISSYFKILVERDRMAQRKRRIRKTQAKAQIGHTP